MRGSFPCQWDIRLGFWYNEMSADMRTGGTTWRFQAEAKSNRGSGCG